MDFFTHQDQARRRSGRLVLLFILGVIGIVLTVFVALSVALGFAQGGFVFDWRLFLATAGGVSLVIFLGSTFKVLTLRQGGSVVAESLGGRLLDRHGNDLYERRLLNVVEEIAIASGTPVPPVYLLEEEAINAFAAGYSPSDAVIGVTRGCMEKLSRDEIQGVVAHEFSHILNGDMRLNIRLIGIVFGILALGLIGRIILQSAFYRRHYRSSSSSSSKNNPLPQIAIGLILMVVGFVGMFFGNLIKAAVSRQREYLADASAVQFTRNPDGIGGALRKLGGFSRGSRMEAASAAEVSHMLFGDGFARKFSSLLATHPPLRDRIRRIDPSFEAFEPVDASYRAAVTPEEVAGFQGAAAGLASAAPSAEAARETPTAESAMGQIGQPGEAHVQYAHALLSSLPPAIVEAAHDPYSARALVYALLINREKEPRKRQLERLEGFAEAPVHRESLSLLAQIDDVDRRARIPLIDMALPSLRQLTADQYAGFTGNLRSLIEADDRIDVFETLLLGTILHHLAPHFGKTVRVPIRHRSLQHLAGECSMLLSTLAHAGHADTGEAREAFAAGAAQIESRGLELVSKERCGLQELTESLNVLNTTSPRCKRAILQACASTISWDHEVSIQEGEIFRIVSDTLDCPSPPLLPGQRLA